MVSRPWGWGKIEELRKKGEKNRASTEEHELSNLSKVYNISQKLLRIKMTVAKIFIYNLCQRYRNLFFSLLNGYLNFSFKKVIV